MQKAEIEQDIRGFLVNTFLFGRAEALGDSAAPLGGVIDSTGAIELVVFLEDHFGITVEDDEVAVPENFGSLKSLASFVEKKLGGNSLSGNSVVR